MSSATPQPRPLTTRNQTLELIGLGCLLLILLLVHLAQREEYWADEGFTVRRVEAHWNQLYYPFAYCPPGGPNPFNRGYVYDLNPPLYFAAVRLLAGPHPGRLLLRLFSIVPMVGALALLAGGAYRRWGKRAALGVTLAGLASPGIIYYGHEARPYALAVLAGTVLLILNRRWPDRPGRSFAAHALAAFAGSLLHFHLAWLILTLGAIELGRAVRAHERKARRAALARLGGLATGSLLALLAILPTHIMFTLAKAQPSQTLTAQKLFISFFPSLAWDSMSHTQEILAGGAAVIFCALVLWAFIRSPGRREGAIWLALWLAPVAMPLLAFLILHQSFFERYTLFALPGWLMLLGWAGHEATARSRLARAGAILLAALIVANGACWGWTNLGKPLRTPWGASIEALKVSAQPNDYYTVQPTWLSLGFAANAQHPPLASYTTLNPVPPPPFRRLWIIGSPWLDPILVNWLHDGGWRYEAVCKPDGYWLWRAER